MKNFQPLLYALLLSLFVACGGDSQSNKEETKKDITILEIHENNVNLSSEATKPDQLPSSITLNKTVVAESFADLKRIRIVLPSLKDKAISGAKFYTGRKEMLKSSSIAGRLDHRELSAPTSLEVTNSGAEILLDVPSDLISKVKLGVVDAMADNREPSNKEIKLFGKLELITSKSDKLNIYIPFSHSLQGTSCTNTLHLTETSQNLTLGKCADTIQSKILLQVLESPQQSLSLATSQLFAVFKVENQSELIEIPVSPSQRLLPYLKAEDITYYILRLNDKQISNITDVVENDHGQIVELSYSLKL